MARGKNGDATAARLRAQHEVEVTELKARHAERVRELELAIQEKEGELARTRSTLRGEAERLAGEGIRAAEAATAAAIVEAQARHDEWVERVVAILSRTEEDTENDIVTSFGKWRDIADALGVPPGRLALGGGSNRRRRRLTPAILEEAHRLRVVDEGGEVRQRPGTRPHTVPARRVDVKVTKG